jgi:hypothetical protein
MSIRPNKTDIKRFLAQAAIDPNRRNATLVEKQVVAQGDSAHFELKIAEQMGHLQRIRSKLRTCPPKNRPAVVKEYQEQMRLALGWGAIAALLLERDTCGTIQTQGTVRARSKDTKGTDQLPTDAGVVRTGDSR